MLMCLLAASLQYCVSPVCLQQVLPHRQFTGGLSPWAPSAQFMLLIIKNGIVSFPHQISGSYTGSLLPFKSTFAFECLIFLGYILHRCALIYIRASSLWHYIQIVSKWASYDQCGRWCLGCLSCTPKSVSQPLNEGLCYETTVCCWLYT